MNPTSADLISYGGESHLVTVAPSRSGKARDVLIPALLSPHIGSAIIVDPKGQLAAVTARQRRGNGRRVYCLSPFPIFTDRLGEPVPYNPMQTLDPESIAFGVDCDSTAQGVIYQTGADTHWADSATQLTSGVIMYVTKYLPPELRNLVTVRSILAGPPSVFNATIDAAMKTGDILLMERLSRFAELSDDDREARSILSVAKTQTAFIGNEAIRKSLTGSGFTFSELREGSDATAYLVLPGEYLHTCGKWFRLVVGSALRELMQGASGGKPVLFLLDEFAQLGRMEALETAIALSAGYGIRLWPVLQDLNQLKDLYPKNWETFLANAGVQQFFTARDLTTAEYISNRCGQRTVMVKNTSTREITKKEKKGGFTGLSHSYAPQSRALFLPQEIMGMRRDRQLLFLDGVENVIVAGRRPYWTMPELTGTYDPDPYHT
jgi:type IV secretion system protein VirD4